MMKLQMPDIPKGWVDIIETIIIGGVAGTVAEQSGYLFKKKE